MDKALLKELDDSERSRINEIKIATKKDNDSPISSFIKSEIAANRIIKS